MIPLKSLNCSANPGLLNLRTQTLRVLSGRPLYIPKQSQRPKYVLFQGALLHGAAKTIEKQKADQITQAYQSLEALLEGHDYVAGNQLTIADFSLVATVSSSNAAIVPVASNTYPRISAWLSRMQALPYYGQANQVGLEHFRAMIQSKLAQAYTSGKTDSFSSNKNIYLINCTQSKHPLI